MLTSVTMSLEMSVADAAVKATCVNIPVTADHPLIRLAQALPWKTLMELVVNHRANPFQDSLYFP